MAKIDLYKLDETTTTGIPVIDGQHTQLFNKINDLLEALLEAKSEQNMGDIITFLENYSNAHFATEEDYLITFNHPGYPRHKKQHDIFRNNVLRLKKVFEKKGGTLELAITVRRMIGDWFINHIITVDMRCFLSLKDKIK